MNEAFIYKHITKLGWYVNIILVLIFAWAFMEYPSNSILGFAIRLYIFGFLWWLIFESFDHLATKYRKRILFRSPEIMHAYINQKMEEINELTSKTKE
jgi:hypothetical protein